jgi:hypothetical protein
MHEVYFHACMYAFMQGTCSSEPSASALGLTGRDLAPRIPGQCVLVTDQVFMRLDQQNLWLDSLYVLFRTSVHVYTCCDAFMLVVHGTGAANLWLTSVTLQGEPHQVDVFSPSNSPGAIDVYGAQLYAEGGDLISPLVRLRNAAVNSALILQRALMLALWLRDAPNASGVALHCTSDWLTSHV